MFYGLKVEEVLQADIQAALSFRGETKIFWDVTFLERIYEPRPFTGERFCKRSNFTIHMATEFKSVKKETTS